MLAARKSWKASAICVLDNVEVPALTSAIILSSSACHATSDSVARCQMSIHTYIHTHRLQLSSRRTRLAMQHARHLCIGTCISTYTHTHIDTHAHTYNVLDWPDDAAFCRYACIPTYTHTHIQSDRKIYTYIQRT
jgi:hypothetical protein